MQFFKIIYNLKEFKVLLVLVVLDTIFGILRAIKEKKVNSNIGIDGCIRKVGMLLSIIFFIMIDLIVELNLIGFLPEAILEVLPIKQVGLSFLFTFLYIVFEFLSVLKNMIRCKLPIPKKFQKFLEDIFKRYTTELDEKKGN